MVKYYQNADGLLQAVLVDEYVDFVPLPGYVEITLAAYNAQRAVIAVDPDAFYDGVNDSDCLARKAVYDDLVANTTLSDATAHALSGWNHGDC